MTTQQIRRKQELMESLKLSFAEKLLMFKFANLPTNPQNDKSNVNEKVKYPKFSDVKKNSSRSYLLHN